MNAPGREKARIVLRPMAVDDAGFKVFANEDGTFSRYDYNKLNGLPHYITCEDADEITVKHNSLSYVPITKPTQLKPSKVLKVVNPNSTNESTTIWASFLLNGSPI